MKHGLLKIITIFSFCQIIPVNVFSQTATISGYVSDKNTGERLTGAAVFVPGLNAGTTCNDFGFYSLTLPAGEIKVNCRFVGYNIFELQFALQNDTVLNIHLESNNVIGEVEVNAALKNNFLASTEMSTNRFSAKEIEKIPVILGEPDVLKAIQLLPGVSFSTEGSTGFSVRGGSPDQTLIRLDGVPVYNVNHVWGFMSAFNNDAIDESKLYKGSLPARFGGRLSSVLDVGMKEGNLKKTKGTFSLSPISGRYTLEGPIVKDKASFMVSARKTWADVLLWVGKELSGANSQALTYGFWDINAKTNWIINQNNRVYLSFYTGRDAYLMEDGGDDYSDYVKFSYNWQNLTGVLRWNHIFSPSLFANFSIYNSRFRQEYNNEYDRNGNEYYKGYNNLNDFSSNGDFNWSLSPGSEFTFGYQLSLQKFSPEIIEYKSDTLSLELNKNIYTQNFVSDFYFDGDIKLTGYLTGNFGLRVGNLHTNGKNYFSFRPRLSFSYLINNETSAKISYSRMKQFLHQLQNTTLGIPTELWVSSTENIEPGSSNLFSTGLFWQPKNKYNFSAEVYFSDQNHILQYKEETLALKENSESWEDYVAIGEGTSYGLELMAEKKCGKLQGFVAYTLSKSTRRFNEINNGDPFPSSYDRRHQLNVSANYLLNEKSKKGKTINRDLSATFNYASGRFISLAVHEYQGLLLPNMEYIEGQTDWYTTRALQNETNNYQLPAFHNLNLSYRIERRSTDKTVVWNFSIYNVYNRLNPWYYYEKDDKIKQISIFPIIPSVSFTYKW